jgi:hypothetical protein
VLGPTFYVANWFGVVVQWCGLEWAQHVIELDADRPDPLLRKIADGVVASGLQQMFDKPPWVGLYPDVWNVEQNVAQGSLIYAGLPLRCLQAQGHAPMWTRSWTRVLRSADGQLRWHVSGWGSAPLLAAPTLPNWSATLVYLAGQPCELLIAGVGEPKQIMLGEEVITNESGPTRWQYGKENRALAIRFITPDTGQATLHVTW